MDVLDGRHARIGVCLVLAEETHTDVDLLDSVFPAGPELEIFRPGEIVAALLVAPVVGRVLPGNADPGADLADEVHLDAGFAFVGVAGMVAVHGQRLD